MTEADFPKIKLGLEGGMWIQHAPRLATFPLDWVMSLPKEHITTHRDLIRFTPTEGDVVTYRIVSYNIDVQRFLAERVPNEVGALPKREGLNI